MSENLRSIFHCEAVDQSELEQLLLIHFGGSQSRNNDEIRYTRGLEGEPALVLRYADDGEIAEIVAGPSIQNDDISAIEEKVTRYLVTASGVQIGQVVLFAILPTVGWFRYKDVFLLLPVPPDAPQVQALVGDHPLLLQYQVKSSGELQIDALRRRRVGREIELLCTALTTTIRGGIGNVVRHHWSIVGGQDPTNWRSEYCQEAYMYPSGNGIAAGFTSTDELDSLSRTPAQTHYTRIGISPGQVLDLPDTFEQSLDTYFAMPRDNQERFIRACFWFQYAQRVATLSYSGAFTALVSAIESLMGDAKPEGHCEKCSRPIGAGPTRRFIEFVEQYAPGPAISNSHRRQLYSLRSALAHGGHLLHTDRYGWGGGMTANALSEETDQRALWHAVRLVLVNWLSAQAAI
jgi:hypothetical protein